MKDPIRQSFRREGAKNHAFSSWLALVVAWLALLGQGRAYPATLTLADYSPTAGAVIQLEGTLGERWIIQYTASLEQMFWTTVGDIDLTATNKGQFLDTSARTVSKRFYRADMVAGAPKLNQVYSVNIVGFSTVQVPSGFTLLSNPFQTTINQVASFFPNVPDGTMLWRTTAGGNSWELNWFAQGQGWAHPAMELAVGEGIWFCNPSPNGVSLTFKGDVLTGAFASTVPEGYSLGSCLGPMNLDFLPVGSAIFKWNPLTGSFGFYYLDPDFGWDPDMPPLNYGEAFYFYTPQRLFGPYLPRMRVFPVTIPPGLTVSPLSPDLGHGRVLDNFGAWLSGCNFRAQFFVGTNGVENEMRASGAPLCFLAGDQAGMISPNVVTNPFVYNGPNLSLQVRVTESNGVRTGKSGMVWVQNAASVVSAPVLISAFANFSVNAGIVPAAASNCAVIKICGPVGAQYRVDWSETTTNWQVLTNIVLPYSPFTIIDVNSIQRLQRFYRTTQVP